MIAFDFDYYAPQTATEAVALFARLRQAGQTPQYYAGGSEILSMARAGSNSPDALIDVKNILELKGVQMRGRDLMLGACETLHALQESPAFPLMGQVAGRIADHTNQCRITLGGNLLGTIQYKEVALPLLLSNAQVFLLGPEGPREAPFAALFQGHLALQPGELLLRVAVPGWALKAPFVHVKRTAYGKIEYPLVTLAVLRDQEGLLRAAFSGLCAAPFRSRELERELNGKASPATRAEKALKHLPEAPMASLGGSGAYRLFAAQAMLTRTLEEMDA